MQSEPLRELSAGIKIMEMFQSVIEKLERLDRQVTNLTYCYREQSGLDEAMAKLDAYQATLEAKP